MKKIVFVCSGNTCRSPMAQYYYKHLLKENKLSQACSSAGIFTANNLPINPYAQKILNDIGIDSSNFLSKQLDANMVASSNLIVCMTRQQANMVKWHSNVITAFDLIGQDVPDPFGQEYKEYLIVFELIKKVCQKILEQQFTPIA